MIFTELYRQKEYNKKLKKVTHSIFIYKNWAVAKLAVSDMAVIQYSS